MPASPPFSCLTQPQCSSKATRTFSCAGEAADSKLSPAFCNPPASPPPGMTCWSQGRARCSKDEAVGRLLQPSSLLPQLCLAHSLHLRQMNAMSNAFSLAFNCRKWPLNTVLSPVKLIMAKIGAAQAAFLDHIQRLTDLATVPSSECCEWRLCLPWLVPHNGSAATANIWTMCLPITLIGTRPLEPQEKAERAQSRRDAAALAALQTSLLQGRKRQSFLSDPHLYGHDQQEWCSSFQRTLCLQLLFSSDQTWDFLSLGKKGEPESTAAPEHTPPRPHAHPDIGNWHRPSHCCSCATQNTAQLVSWHLRLPFGAMEELSLTVTDALIKLSSLIATRCHHRAQVTSPGRGQPLSPGLHHTSGDVVNILFNPRDGTPGFFKVAENPPAIPEFTVSLSCFRSKHTSISSHFLNYTWAASICFLLKLLKNCGFKSSPPTWPLLALLPLRRNCEQQEQRGASESPEQE